MIFVGVREGNGMEWGHSTDLVLSTARRWQPPGLQGRKGKEEEENMKKGEREHEEMAFAEGETTTCGTRGSGKKMR